MKGSGESFDHFVLLGRGGYYHLKILALDWHIVLLSM